MTHELLLGILDRAMGPLGGFVVVFVVCFWLAYDLRACKKQHAVLDAEYERQHDKNTKLAVAYAELSGAVNALIGREVVDVHSLAEVMSGKAAVNYKAWTRAGRRREDRQPEGDATGGADAVR